MGGEAARLRPRLVVETFRQWTNRELDFRQEAASASELRENLVAETGFFVPEIDWSRTSRRVMTLEWIDGIKLTDRKKLLEAGHDVKTLAATLVRVFLRQAVVDGFFHADLHQGNLFALPDGRLAAIDFGIMGRIDRQARIWLAEILYGLLTGNYRRVAEIHFEAQYVPPHHNIEEFATALRAVGEPMRGLAAKEVSLGQMLEGLFKITRDFDMPTQPHLLLLQKTMVMEEGVATWLDPDINMWETAEPFLTEWARSELGPEARIADELIRGFRLLRKLPDLIRRIDYYYPPPGAAPPTPPLPDIALVRPHRAWPLVLTALLAAAAGIVAGVYLF
jgi:ubiquinone biosynthesis protein